MDISRFPTEILSRILAHVRVPGLEWPDDIRQVANARLVCRKWNELATPHLFRSLHIGHHCSSLLSWDAVVDVPEVRSAAQHVSIFAAPETAMKRLDGLWVYGCEKAAYHALMDCVGGITKLPNLRELHIRFYQWCADESQWLTFRDMGRQSDFGLPFKDKNVFLAVFSALRRRIAEMPQATRVHSLTLTNPHNMPLPALVESELFPEVAGHIDSLHLLVTEDRLVSAEFVIVPPGGWVREYELHLQEKLLPPLSNQLATLTLAFHERWGLLPAYFNPRQLSFPRLRTLTLAEFVIGHEDHLEWVLAQTSLTTLRLHRCYIASHLRLLRRDVESWRLRTDDWEQKPLGSYGFVKNDHAVYTYPGTWAIVFGRMSTRLPSLIDLRLENDKPRFWFRLHGMEGAQLSKRRYIVFDVGHPRSPWVEADENGELEFGNNDPEPVMLDGGGGACDVEMSLNRAAETEQADGEALEALLETIRERWRIV